MRECDNLIHPFQNDPGVSQRQRVMEDLLSGSAKIDGRTLADLLDYFMQLSHHIKFYEEDLSVSDWQPFFQKSLPFTVAAMSKFESDSIEEKLVFYHQLFRKAPSSSGLQLLIHFLYYRLINPLNTWQQQTHGSELPVAFALEKLIKDKLQRTVKEFIRHTNSAVKWYCIKPVDWQKLHINEVWNLSTSDLHDFDENIIDQGTDRRERKIALYDAIRGLSIAFLDVIRLVADAASNSMNQSLIPLKAELQEKHQPHLALLFAFLKLFRYLQDDLNRFTKKHLDFFYKQVLQLDSRDAVPDKAHIVFEIQKQLDSYLLEKGLQVKDGKDGNKAEVLFALDDEIVVNKAQVAQKRTLFLNNKTVHDTTFVEGVYMASDAGKADGIDKDFKENGLISFPTLGAKNSKYIDPEHGFIKPYPNARLGFILASPVLLLNEGKRTVDITLDCELKDNYCAGLAAITGGNSDPCCEDNGGEDIIQQVTRETADFKSACELYERVSETLCKSYYYISQDLIAQAQKKGIGADLIDRLKSFLITQKEICYCETDLIEYDVIVPAISREDAAARGFENEFNEGEREILAEFFKPRKALNIRFSGEKEWIEPSEITAITLDPVPEDMICDSDPNKNSTYPFTLKITVVLDADKPAVTFYDNEQLKEDFDTTLPLVKIELDDKIKIEPDSDEDEIEEENGDSDLINCCLEKDPPEGGPDLSMYHFFRNVIIDDTTIDVEACGIKDLIVQNDESVQDVNSPIYPFGTRPEIADFDIVNSAEPPLTSPNLVGPNFYIGSAEVFCKKWNNVRININWKDKPSNFREYYKAYWVDPVDSSIYGLDDEDFQINIAVLDNGKWRKEKAHALFSLPASNTVLNANTGDDNRPLFKNEILNSFCIPANPIEQTIHVSNSYFDGYNQKFTIPLDELKRYSVDTPFGFFRINLQNQDFLHKDYAFVLARQMMALGRYPDGEGLVGAVYIGFGGTVIVFKDIGTLIVEIKNEIIDAATEAGLTKTQAENIITQLGIVRDSSSPGGVSITNAEFLNRLNNPISETVGHADDTKILVDAIVAKVNDLIDRLSIFSSSGDLEEDLSIPIPNEPWTPIIMEMSIDYTATATITDVDLIHLFPYEGTYKPEELESNPTLLPPFCDEGTLFLGLKDLVPGSNVNMLFQLAEATVDSESEREELHWFYLDNNQWKLLREGFEVLDDATNGLTASGIVKFALPANMTSDNTILPKGLHWIKAVIPQNSRSVSETIGIHTQAVRVTFTNEAANDRLRLTNVLPAGSVAKLKEADAFVKKVNQPYDGFGGRLPEDAGHFYVRASELLRHKGRSIQKFDYERLTLEAFPTLFKVKCINHSFGLNAHKYFNDFPVAPGYVLLAVIPDLNQLKAAVSFEPRAPVSLLEKVKGYLGERTSPFVRLKIMNPRYEKVHLCLKVKLYPGRDETFYKEKLRQELREFLAPWAVGQYDKLTFGQCIYRSDIVRFLESSDYLDYLLELKMIHETETGPPVDLQKVCPVTPRSILIAGDIDVCIRQQDCETWNKCYEHDREVDCCDHESIAVADYCKEPEIN
jgi:hypothetical protein